MERLFVVMGVSGCGKSTIGEALAAELGGTYFDGDDFHEPEKVEKMRSGTPLTDSDRWPWLWKLGKMMSECEGVVVLACSSLKRAYRDRITEAAGEPVLFIHLTGSEQLVTARQAARVGHYMPPSLVHSQYETLEPPSPDERAVTVGIDQPPDKVLADVFAILKERKSSE